MQARTDKIALFDMDGTLFDYEGQLRKDLAELASPGEEAAAANPWEGPDQPWLKARINLIKNQPGWWRDLPIFPLGWTIYHSAQKMGFYCKVLTKGPRRRSIAWTEKVDCIDKHFGDDMPIDIVGEDKGGTYGRVLVDDYPDYMQSWLDQRPRGLGIMPAHHYNEDFTHPNVIRFDGNNLDEVINALQTAFDRESKEELDLK